MTVSITLHASDGAADCSRAEVQALLINGCGLRFDSATLSFASPDATHPMRVVAAHGHRSEGGGWGYVLAGPHLPERINLLDITCAASSPSIETARALARHLADTLGWQLEEAAS